MTQTAHFFLESNPFRIERMIKRGLITVIAAAALGLVGTAPAMAAQEYPLNFKTFGLRSASSTGTVYVNGSLTLGGTISSPVPYADPFVNYSNDGVDGSGNYEYGTWTSGVTNLFPFSELVSSWSARTPAGTWIQVEVQPQIDDGDWAKWYILGRWSSDDGSFHRPSVGGQGDADGFVSIDTFFAKDHPAVAYRLRVTLFRKAGAASPSVSRLSAIAMNLTNQKMTFPSSTTIRSQIDLGLPQHSQEIHHGDFPQYDNGGEAWCSPTSTSMVVDYWSQVTGTNYSPTPAEYSWAPPQPRPHHTDPQLAPPARRAYHNHYTGAGNWPSNAAYAASRGLVADVTALHNLREAEPFINAGVPLVASVAGESNKLEGGIKSTNGHLMVIGGFTANGNVIAYDPAPATDAPGRE